MNKRIIKIIPGLIAFSCISLNSVSAFAFVSASSSSAVSSFSGYANSESYHTSTSDSHISISSYSTSYHSQSSVDNYPSTSASSVTSYPTANCKLPPLSVDTYGGNYESSLTSSSVSSFLPLSEIGCEIQSVNKWEQSVQFEVAVTNYADTTVQNWQTKIAVPDGFSITNYWNGEVTLNTDLSVTNTTWNESLSAGETVIVGIQGSYSGEYLEPRCILPVEESVTEIEPKFEIKTFGQTVYVDASKTRTPQGSAKYIIDFGDGTTIPDRQAWHTYRYEGEHDISLTVSLDDEQVSLSQVVTTEIVEGENTAPLLYPSHHEAYSGGMTWDAEGDEVEVTERAIDYQYENYLVSVIMIVEASDGELKDTQVVSRKYCSRISLDPGSYAKINYRIEGMTVIADGMDSINASGFIWRFGDGSPDVYDTPKVIHTYSEPGSYTLELKPLGEMIGNFSDFVSFTIAAENNPPVASLKCEEAEDVEAGLKTLSCEDLSTDPENDTLSRTWKIVDGEETLLYRDSSESRIEYSFQSSGENSITVVVTDGEYESSLSSSEVQLSVCEKSCDWYGKVYPLCKNTNSGWGWEENTACISQSTCGVQFGNGGIITDCH